MTVGEPSLVSVVIPTYQRSDTILRAIASVRGQSYPNWELWIVDDASTDDTAEVVQRLDDARIHYLRQDVNRGTGAARNAGMARARGDYIAFLDSDDEWLPHKIQAQIDCFERALPTTGLVYSGAWRIRSPDNVQAIQPSARGAIFHRLLRENVLLGGGSSVMIRRSVWEEVGGFDEELPAIEDFEYWVRVARSFDVDYVAEPLVRWHDPLGGERRSREWGDNLAARGAFYERYRVELEEAGLAAEFLCDSARRQLNADFWRPRKARALAVRALRIRPWSGRAWGLLLMSCLPFFLYQLFARTVRAVLRR